ncbi:isopentenyl pyrophosphate isomerase [Staphylococcus saprophyticus]|jgi:isopentenyl-diphosphate delta-isomerase|uniref:Isopentenyl-diphosphate delta-isomerase n=1 Tax=Staphylococcus saprophyticus subsp. saprophyticus (strain ATCC 15305 / DSM 20229 / NCIMB 8711 / NCTC 7292 / S-41) TaxID=342451 RepID=IDI2_STAS1|nr:MULTISPECIES: type 2 isopentenyl-diphosphate Delta-isomerase [Staphylococcus]Q49ZS3.1 RecName: Full=Isopentenyl-diphosphate delta-isomerase; Short=IPP isomerase; AltName: Full=Isopentenyl diphosphate:dimethylallyl diphosphate isomerase; AltName: Full=Isopentenyl pyrophosphate isomerase; AltName: Full=Type 2 isopentenyl diphosphate isomerase; Short=IDI-2 [Staphylococcus saprophyticus subsp. saprophyticus ATCC 15305 = NCTC 7292]CRV27295.1 isopentenyl pyrophosphate isomerase [Streptococcus equi s
MSDNKREQRKNEHVEIAMAQGDATISDFDEIRFVHHSIPSVDVDDIDLTSQLKDFTLDQPLYINAMTGGSEWTKQINEKLAVIARETGIAMAVGSTHAALRNSKMASSFSIVRDTNPNGIIFSNVGADVPVDKAVESVKLLDAQALQVHVNAPQELVMPEGNRTFSTWMENLAQIVSRVDVPVIVKEVGFGMSKETIKSLNEIGVRYVDVSGRGGTNFVDIENERRTYKDMDYLGLWGQTTVESLLESASYQQDMDILASGGVRTPLDAVKCLALGASAVGMSRPFLNQVENYGITETLNYTEQFTDHMKKIMTMLDVKTIKDLKQTQMVFSPKLQSWIEQRGLDIR